MSDPLLVVTATAGVDAKFLTRLAIELRDYEFCEYTETNDDRYVVALSPSDAKKSIRLQPPILDWKDQDNHFAGKTLQEIETFATEYQNEEDTEVDYYNFFVIDDRAVQDGTCVLLSRRMDEEGQWREFQKMRLPRGSADTTWANLNIANMDFEDFCAEPEDGPADPDNELNQPYWCSFSDPGVREAAIEKNNVMKSKALKALGELGHV
ncbi:hypothetical protein K461DRAFT_293200 [Myriangium duriaei CBS 260.36]|uniref:DUF6924 domain-containing protein n=1 Tax=Myriangium duriaei CBS 260.36 TaxID=1168546 RepID=A0A9P4J5R1_9PEZI|nr:hypothetical protein K461DRAFT_293200 [Myriangium duriaei CBS 260.36]